MCAGPAGYSSLAAMPRTAADRESAIVGVVYESSQDSTPSIDFEAITFAQVSFKAQASEKDPGALG